MKLSEEKSRKVEKALRVSEERDRLIVNTAMDAVITADSEGRITDWSAQAEAIFGWSSEDAIGKLLTETIIPSRYRDAHTRGLERFHAAGGGHLLNKRIEIEGRRCDGSEFPVELTIAAAQLGEEEMFIGFLRDITERKRAEERISLLQTITMDVAAARDLASALKVVLRRVCEKTGWVIGQVWMPCPEGTVLDWHTAWLFDDGNLNAFKAASEQMHFLPGEGLPGRVWSLKQLAWVQDVTVDSNFPRAKLAQEAGLKAALGIPIMSDENLVAVLEFFLREPRREDERLVRVVTTIAAQLSLLIKRKQAEQELQRLTEGLIHIQDQERKRIAAELHDGLGQSLAIIRNRVSICLRDVSDAVMVKEQLEEIADTTTSTIDEVREIAHNLRPYELDRLGLAHAVESMVEKVKHSSFIEISADLASVDGLLSTDKETGVYRIIQEGLNNVTRHAAATKAWVTIDIIDNEIVVTIKDNGRGFSPSGGGHRGFGLAGIAERSRIMGGTFAIDSGPGKGTQLIFRCGVKESDH